MDCCDELVIMMYVDGELDAETRDHLSRHLDVCERCRAVARSFGATDGLLDAMGTVPVPEGFSERILRVARRRVQGVPPRRGVRRLLSRLAAAAVLVAAVGVFFALAARLRPVASSGQLTGPVPVRELAETIELFENLEVVDDAELFIQIEAVSWSGQDDPPQADPGGGST